MKVFAGDFKKIYNPSTEDTQWYINDHTLIKGKDGWHLFGITHEEPSAPLCEKICAHAFSKDLLNEPFKKLEPTFFTDENYGESVFWAPHVIETDGKYHMFYCGGSLNGHSDYRIMHAESVDLLNWKRCAENPVVTDGFDARDPMVINHNGKWLLYYTCTTSPEGGNHCVRLLVSPDLYNWTAAGEVFIDDEKGTWGGPCESPFVLKKDNKFYLFLSLRGAYSATDVFVSENPFDFSAKEQVGSINAHAAEVITVGNDYYVTHCGWGQGGVYIAPLRFEK